jgi:hypothetical protein
MEVTTNSSGDPPFEPYKTPEPYSGVYRKIPDTTEIPPPLSINQCAAIWHRLRSRFDRKRSLAEAVRAPNSGDVVDFELYLAVSRRLINAAQIERITEQEAT